MTNTIRLPLLTILALVAGCTDAPTNAPAPAVLAAEMSDVAATAQGPAVVDLMIQTVATDSAGAEGDWAQLLQRVDFRTIVKFWPVKNAFIARMPANEAAKLPSLARWAAVVTPVAIPPVFRVDQQSSVPWELARITNVAWPKAGPLTFEPAGRGAGATVYVLDTGLDVNHPELRGRASVLWSAWGPGDDVTNDACALGRSGGSASSYHGTGVASKVAGASVGIAPAARVVGLRAFQCLPWQQPDALSIVGAFYELQRRGVRNAIINVSGDQWIDPSSPDHSLFRTYIAHMLASTGSILVIADQNPSTWTPGRPSCSWLLHSVPEAIVVSSIDLQERNVAPSSCVDIFAPGRGVTVAHGSSLTQESGNSFAAPLVAGVLAQYQGKAPGAPSSALVSALLTNAIANRLPSASAIPNRLLFAGASRRAMVVGTSLHQRSGSISLPVRFPTVAAPQVHRMLAAWGYIWSDTMTRRPSSAMTVNGAMPITMHVRGYDPGTWAGLGLASHGFVAEYAPPTFSGPSGSLTVSGWNQPTAAPYDEGARGVTAVLVYSDPQALVQAPLTEVVVEPFFHQAIASGGAATVTLTLPIGMSVDGGPAGAHHSRHWYLVGDGEQGTSIVRWAGSVASGSQSNVFRNELGTYWNLLQVSSASALAAGDTRLRLDVQSTGDWLFWLGNVWEVSVR